MPHGRRLLSQPSELRGDGVVVVHTDEMAWAPSPSPSVFRKRLEHVGHVEAGRVTSVVRYAAGSDFRRHPHPDGEEILVLEGIFTDDRGDHPAGTYLLNPEGFEHAPGSRDGCVLFVKLRQYPGIGRRTVRVQRSELPIEDHPTVAGARVQVLYAEPGCAERVHVLTLAENVEVPEVEMVGGEEIFVLEGGFEDEHGAYREGSWVRYPPGTRHAPRTSSGCVLYVKSGHLRG